MKKFSFLGVSVFIILLLLLLLLVLIFAEQAGSLGVWAFGSFEFKEEESRQAGIE